MMNLGYKHWTSAIGIRYDEPRRWSKTRGDRRTGAMGKLAAVGGLAGDKADGVGFLAHDAV